MGQQANEVNKSKLIFISSVSILSFILSIFINSVLAASVWKAPTANPPDGNVGAPLYNEEVTNPNLFAIIDRSFVTFTGGIVTQTLKNCGKIYSDSNGSFQCGIDAGSGLIDLNTQTSGSLDLSRTTGSLDLSSRTTGNLDLSRTTGNLDLSRTTGNLDLSRTTGNLDLSRTTGNLDLSRTTGNLDLSRTTGNLDLSRTTGNLDLSRTTGYLDFSRTTGAIDINSRTTGVLPSSRVTVPPLNCTTKTKGGTAYSGASGTWFNGAGDGRLYVAVDCDAGWTMTGGGCLSNEYCWTDVVMIHSYPSSNGWVCGQNVPGCGWYLPTAYVRCCKSS